jgi:hypothetical protein
MAVFKNKKPDPGQQNPMRSQGIMIKSAEDHGRRKHQQRRADDFQRVGTGKFLQQKDANGHLPDDGGHFPQPQVLKIRAQPGRKQLEGKGKQRDRIHEGDARPKREAVSLDPPQRKAPGLLAEPLPAELVLQHISTADIDPVHVRGEKRFPTVQQEKPDKAEQDPQKQVRADSDQVRVQFLGEKIMQSDSLSFQKFNHATIITIVFYAFSGAPPPFTLFA